MSTMEIKDIMTRNVACCTPATSLQEVARMMVDNDCGEIPVVSDHSSMKLVGVVTDRDITIRTVARGENPLEKSAGDVMSQPAHSVKISSSIEECCDVMEAKKIRRVPITDENGSCCGIVSQADIANKLDEQQTAEVVREVSEPA
jgi:CBS domain-containing protein